MDDLKKLVGKMQSLAKGMKIGPGNVQSSEELHQTISVVAYQLAERRHFDPVHEMEDWLEAEAQVLAEVEGWKGLPA